MKLANESVQGLRMPADWVVTVISTKRAPSTVKKYKIEDSLFEARQLYSFITNENTI